MTRAKVPPQLVLVVVACLLAGVIGFQALAERSRTRLFYDRLQKMDEINKKLKLGLTVSNLTFTWRLCMLHGLLLGRLQLWYLNPILSRKKAGRNTQDMLLHDPRVTGSLVSAH